MHRWERCGELCEHPYIAESGRNLMHKSSWDFVMALIFGFPILRAIKKIMWYHYGPGFWIFQFLGPYQSFMALFQLIFTRPKQPYKRPSKNESYYHIPHKSTRAVLISSHCDEVCTTASLRHLIAQCYRH